MQRFLPDAEIKAIAGELIEAYVAARRHDRGISLELLVGRLNREGWDYEVHERDGRNGPWLQVFGQHLTRPDLDQVIAAAIATLPTVLLERAE